MQTHDYAWAALWDTAIKFSLQSRAMTSLDHLARNRDYHWYRLDGNGYWSHKPGGTCATNRDGRGKRIKDPRRADNGLIPYKFVCFMTIDRFGVKIK